MLEVVLRALLKSFFSLFEKIEKNAIDDYSIASVIFNWLFLLFLFGLRTSRAALNVFLVCCALRSADFFSNSSNFALLTEALATATSARAISTAALAV